MGLLQGRGKRGLRVSAITRMPLAINICEVVLVLTKHSISGRYNV
jgi:hypothetical protein